MVVIRTGLREARLKQQIRAHLKQLGFTRDAEGILEPPRLDKGGYRAVHEPQRRERLAEERRFLEEKGAGLLQHFANGEEIDVSRISIQMIPIAHSTWQSDLFRLATLCWSVPVSMGFGRRLRYLIWDSHAEKLVGLLALGDPVFNLNARDGHIGWTVRDRERRLVQILDGYVVGAVPPYNQLLCGKLVACLMRTREVIDEFRERYAGTKGVISGRRKDAHLVAVTTTSALGRSSIYNRLRLDGIPYLESIGYTGGYGHFHFPQRLFAELREYLKFRKDPYAANHEYGEGPNWRLRSIKRALGLLGLDPDLLKHGFTREVFLGKVADNALEILTGKRKRPKYATLRTAAEVSELALNRWVRPRAARDHAFRRFTRNELLARFDFKTTVRSARRSRRAHG